MREGAQGGWQPRVKSRRGCVTRGVLGRNDIRYWYDIRSNVTSSPRPTITAGQDLINKDK